MSKVSTLNIQKLTDRPRYANMLIYGESGVGKTTFAATAPRPILWLDSEGGTASIGDTSDIFVAKVDSLDTFREAVVYLQQNEGKFKTVVIDSFSETQAHILKEVMRAVVKNDPTRDEFLPQFQEWGRVTGVMREIARAFRDLPLNTIVTALTREDTDDLTGRVKIRPRLSPTLADELPAFMDVTGYLYTVTAKGGEVGSGGVDAESDDEKKAPEVVRNLLLQPTGKYAAKLRAPSGSNPPTHLKDPTFDEVVKLLFPKA